MRIVHLAAGVIIGAKYQLAKLIGRGGYAEVWKASRLPDGCDVALKIYRDTERSDKALLREALLAQAFQHENVVRVYGELLFKDIAVKEEYGIECLVLGRSSHSVQSEGGDESLHLFIGL